MNVKKIAVISALVVASLLTAFVAPGDVLDTVEDNADFDIDKFAQAVDLNDEAVVQFENCEIYIVIDVNRTCENPTARQRFERRISLREVDEISGNFWGDQAIVKIDFNETVSNGLNSALKILKERHALSESDGLSDFDRYIYKSKEAGDLLSRLGIRSLTKYGYCGDRQGLSINTSAGFRFVMSHMRARETISMLRGAHALCQPSDN